MRGNRSRKGLWTSIALFGLVAPFEILCAQTPDAPLPAKQTPAQTDVAALSTMLQRLQSQVETLNAQVAEMRSQQEAARAQSAEMRKELETAKSQLARFERPGDKTETATGPAAAVPIDERLNRIEEIQQLADAKIAEQSQTKVESSSKYRIRLSGIVLFNMGINRGNVDNADFPQLATPPELLASDGSFVGSLRQSQIGLEAYGPTIAGAKTSADVRFDFAGGFPVTSNGSSFGIMRLRTATVHFDWEKTSVVAGQDSLFFSPLSPTSLATLAVPALAYSGNLWAWTPQVHVEHRFTVSDTASLSVQGGILDSLSGDLPQTTFYRYPTWGESSGQPAYASRIAWTQKLGEQNLIFGVGGYYGRQDWGFHRSIDGWAGMLDLTVPLGNRFEFTSQFYRGRAVGGLGGGIGQSVLWNGSLLDAATELYGLNSLGGWAQLKFKATPKLQFNGAFGQDNPVASELRQFGGNATIYGAPLSKNQSGFVNFLYQPRSDIVFSLEYRKIRTYILDQENYSANLVNVSIGYIF